MSSHRPTSMRMYGPAAKLRWFAGYIAVLLLPFLLTWFVLRGSRIRPGEGLALSAGIVGFSALAVAVVLPARLRRLVATFGIETVLRIHRVIAMLAGVLVLVHVVVVLFVDPRGLHIFELWHTTWAARAATASTAALVLMISLAIRRRRRQPRYEGWRLVHNGLAAIVLAGAWLHVWFLGHLVHHPLLGGWFVLVGGLAAGLAARRWIWLPLQARRNVYSVETVRPEPGDAVTLVLRADGHDGMQFHAGQFAWIKIGSTPFVFEEHPFSVASTAEHPEHVEFTIKALGDFTELVSALRPGRRVYLDGPYGGFTIEGHTASEGFVMIAGGVGITPLLSMLRTLADRGDQRRHRLIVGARTEDRMLLRPSIDELRGRLNLKVIEVVESPGDQWRGEVGRIDVHLLSRVLPRRARHLDYFLCGPPTMVSGICEDLRDLGVPLRRVHTELFSSV